jgi:hypothetical protein
MGGTDLERPCVWHTVEAALRQDADPETEAEGRPDRHGGDAADAGPCARRGRARRVLSASLSPADRELMTELRDDEGRFESPATRMNRLIRERGRPRIHVVTETPVATRAINRAWRREASTDHATVHDDAA